MLDEESSEIWCHLRAYVVSLSCECVKLFKYGRGFTVLYRTSLILLSVEEVRMTYAHILRNVLSM